LIGVIIQARQGSTRLPGKMSLKFYKEYSILELIIKRIKKALPDTKVILATTTKKADDELCFVADKYEVPVFRGSESDVLDRFVQAAKQNNITKIIRVCADNPFIDMIALKELIDTFNTKNLDYLSFETNKNIPVIKTHYGFWAEAVKLSAIESVKSSDKYDYYKEHVTNYIYEHANDYKIEFLPIPQYLIQEDIRLTIDTKKDFETAQAVFKEVGCDFDFSIKNVYDVVVSKKEWLNSMVNQINEQKK